MIRAAIDIGSNSVLLCIANVSGEFKVLADISRVTQLGKSLDKTGVFHPDSMRATKLALEDYVSICKNEYKILSQDIIITATEASRVAKNSDLFYSDLKKSLGIKVCIINAEGEAYYTALGVGLSSSKKDCAIIDIGGASTEIIFFDNGKKEILSFTSLAVGSVRASDWIKEGVFKTNLKKALKELPNDTSNCALLNSIWVAGTVTSLVSIYKKLDLYDASKVHDSVLNLKEVEEVHGILEKLTSEQIAVNYPILGKRSSSIAGGAKLVLELLRKLNLENFSISTFGLRHGTVFKGAIDEYYISK
ncbi:hypothetical protein N9O57_00660 [bacterium]|nr:hypothetical protein [bacterium]